MVTKPKKTGKKLTTTSAKFKESKQNSKNSQQIKPNQAVKTQPYSVYVEAYKIETPIFNTDTNTAPQGYFNNNIFGGFLTDIVKSGNNKYMDGSRYLQLVSLKQSSDADILEGKIHTTRYGTQGDIIDTTTDQVVNQIDPVQGVKNEINFVINKNNGKLLIQKDPFRIFNRSLFIEFLEKRKYLGKKPIQQFNLANKPNLISDQSFFTISTIYDEGFYDQIAKIANIKSISINTKVEKNEVNEAIAMFTRERIENVNIPDEDDYCPTEITEMTYTFKNSVRNQGIKGVRRFVQNALDFEKIESIVAKGPSNGKSIKAEFKIKPKTFPIKTTKNSNGILDQSKIITEMINLIKTI
ncbi:hypothetical protein U2I53_05540 [Lysinibacillus capsici]|uniref:hypothetical protein n=1 Tax=Lysinibacillus capsici TaxID=2115968 RepID=UPI0032DEF8D2